MFSLDILKAKYGDCLMLRCGGDDPVHILIDGGPSATFKQALKPRLKALAKAVSDERKPLIDLLMVSHIDADHIGGVIKLLKHQKAARAGEKKSLVRFKQLWHNSFLNILSEAAKSSPTAQTGAVKPASLVKQLAGQLQLGSDSKVVMASVKDGNELTRLARFHNMHVNQGFADGLAIEGQSSNDFAPFKLHVLGPKKAELDKLREDWIEYMQKHQQRDEGVEAAAAEKLDSAVANLSSIVVMVECEGRRVLLTGDARGDYVIEALERNGYMKDGVCKLDVFKWPHHGSIKNLPKGIFKSIVADHHIISANGRHDNPDLASIERFVQEHAVGQASTLHMTYAPAELDHGPQLKAILTAARNEHHKIAENSPLIDGSPWITLDFN